MAQLMQQGQALSTWSFSGSVNDTNTALFQDVIHTTSLRPIRIQGIYWTGAATLNITDSAGISLFNVTSTSPAIYPPDASGSYGIVTNVPLFMKVGATPPGGGGVLILYGRVL